MEKEFDNVIENDNKELENKNKPAKENKEVKETQKFEVTAIINEKAVMTKGKKDGKFYSKPNNKYRVGQLID